MQPIHIRFTDETGGPLGSDTFELEVFAAALPVYMNGHGFLVEADSTCVRHNTDRFKSGT
jgi:hypothetical protein